MENYLSDFENGGNGSSPKRRRGFSFLTLLLACLLCAVIGAGSACAFMAYWLPSLHNADTSQPVNAEKQQDNQLTDSPLGIMMNSSLLGATTDNTDTIEVARTVSPSVVFISNIQNVRVFNSYFNRSNQLTEMVASSGSGVIYSTDGYIITNNHVVSGAEKISVTLYNGNSYLAEVVGTDERTDLAVIKIEPNEQLTAATFGNSDQLVVGEKAIAIGNPGGENFTNSLTQGVISGLNRSISTSTGTVLKVLQTDAAINPGNSGGALCNSRGEVIGINTIKISITGYEGMGFAIPSNDVVNICQQLMKNGKVLRPALGVGIVCDVTPQLAYYNDLQVDYGVAVVPTEGSAAAKAGIEDYDIIVAIDGEKIETFSALQSTIFDHEIGDKVTVTVMRGEEKLDFEITLQELES